MLTADHGTSNKSAQAQDCVRRKPRAERDCETARFPQIAFPIFPSAQLASARRRETKPLSPLTLCASAPHLSHASHNSRPLRPSAPFLARWLHGFLASPLPSCPSLDLPRFPLNFPAPNPRKPIKNSRENLTSPPPLPSPFRRQLPPRSTLTSARTDKAQFTQHFLAAGPRASPA
jgi:hypothetical protein